MRKELRYLLLPLMALIMTGCEPSSKDETAVTSTDTEIPEDKIKGRTRNAESCTEGLEDYCRGWHVTESNLTIKSKHLDIGDELVIGKKSNGEDSFLWLFARSPEPKTRWGGPDKVKLTEITTDDGAHDCLAGKLKLENEHAGDDSHMWHKLTLRLKDVPLTEIKGEKLLEICFTPKDGGSPPTTCEKVGCPDPDDPDPRLHGGRAHAQD